MIYKAKGDSDQALNYFLQALSITEKMSPDDNLRTAMVSENIGKVYSIQNSYDTALLIYPFRALKILKNFQPEQHRDIAQYLGTIAYVYEKKEDCNGALDYYHQQLNIEERYLPFDQPNLTNHLD